MVCVCGPKGVWRGMTLAVNKELVMKVIAVGKVLPSGKARAVQLDGERFAVLGSPDLRPGDSVLLRELPGTDADGIMRPPSLWAEKAELD